MKSIMSLVFLAASSALAAPANVTRSNSIQIGDLWARATPISPGATMHFTVTDPNYPDDTPTDCNLIW